MNNFLPLFGTYLQIEFYKWLKLQGIFIARSEELARPGGGKLKIPTINAIHYQELEVPFENKASDLAFGKELSKCLLFLKCP